MIAEDEASANNWLLRFEVRDGIPGNYAIPQRVQAECAAKRKVVEDFEHYAELVDVERTEFAIGRRHAAALAVQRVATIYANHPDFREEWRV